MNKDLTQEEFRDLVATDVRGSISKEDAAWLRSSEVVDDFYDTLVLLARNVDLQFARKKAEKQEKSTTLASNDAELHDYNAEVAAWKVKTLRFKQVIEERIAECRKIRRTGIAKDLVPVAGLELLVHAIETHRNVISADDEGADDTADEELWSILNAPSVETIKVLLSQVS